VLNLAGLARRTHTLKGVYPQVRTMDRSSVGVADVRGLAGDLLVKSAVLVAALATTVVALGTAQVAGGWIIGELAGAWPVVDPATTPLPVATVAVTTVVVVGLAAATILLPALAPFVAVAVVDPLIVQSLLGHRPSGGEEEARPAAQPYLQWGRAGIVIGLLVVGVGITALYWVPVVPDAFVPGSVARLAALLPGGLVARPLAFLYLGVGGTVVARPRGWHLRLENMPLRIVAGRPLGLDNTGPITPVGERVGAGAGTPVGGGSSTPVDADDGGGPGETQVWVEGGGGETLVYDPHLQSDDEDETDDDAGERSDGNPDDDPNDDAGEGWEASEGWEDADPDDADGDETPTPPGTGDGEE